MNVRNSLLILILAVAILFPCVALAVSDISNAGYLGEIDISNNGTIAYDVSVPFTANTTSMIATGKLNATASDAAMRDANGDDVCFMPGYGDSNPWVTFVDEIGAETTITHYLSTCNVTGGEYRYFPGPAGMTVSDNETLELGDNFTHTFLGFIDTTAVGDNITSKEDALRTYISGSGNITTELGLEYTQTTQTQVEAVYSAQSILGQRIDDFPILTIDSISFYLSKTGSPTGTANITVRAVDGDSIIGIIDTLDVSTLTGDLTWYDFDTTPVSITSVQDLRFCIEYSGGDAGNRPSVGDVHSDVADGYVTFYDGSWNAVSTKDLTHKIYFTISATIPDISSGEYEIEVGADGSFFGIGADADTADFPISDNLTFNAPLYHADLNGATFTTKDANGHSCTVSEAVWSTSGYTFDGVDDEISFSGYSANNTWAVGGWFYITENDICSIIGDTTGTYGYVYYRDDIKQFRYEPSSIDGNTLAITGTNDHLLNEWHHIFIIMDNPTMYFFVDDELVGQANPVDAVCDLSITRIGRGYTGLADCYFEGIIGEIRIYSDAIDGTANYNATLWKYNGSSEYFHYQYSGGASVADNSNDWVFFSGDAVRYMEYAEIEVDGVQSGYWEWEYATTFTDQSGNSNTATPTFRTESSDENVSAELVSFTGARGTTNPPAAGGVGWTMIPEVPSGPDTLLSELDMSFLGAGYIQTFCDSTDIPLALIVFPYAFGMAIIFGAIAWYLSSGGGKHPHGRGSLLVMASVSLLVMVYFVYSGDGVIPAWVLFPFGLEALAFIVWRQTPSPY